MKGSQKSCKRPTSSQMNALFKRIRDAGLQVVPAKSGHWKVLDADGKYLVTCSGSPKGCHAVDQTLRELRRYHGIEID